MKWSKNEYNNVILEDDNFKIIIKDNVGTSTPLYYIYINDVETVKYSLSSVYDFIKENTI